MKQIEVQILQQSYLLSCPEGQEARLLDAVERVDTAMTRIRDAGKVRVRERIAVLAALNLAFALAERENAAITTAAQSQAASDSTHLPAGASQRLQTLVQRLDDALGTNGMLFE